MSERILFEVVNGIARLSERKLLIVRGLRSSEAILRRLPCLATRHQAIDIVNDRFC